ncbi:MAG: multidrug ABC transporter substrate-binding protein [Gammaproteobacteria bacterium]|nr:MAG: multidrug ABC transporter substrate-binding protein [Gammaproteobacteria bacterium]
MNYFLRKISFRYLYHKGSKAPSSQTILTSLGVGFGTAVLIIVLSVMNGFENELQKRILGVIPHVTLESSGGFEDLENISEIILKESNVEAVAPFLSSQVVINSNDVSKGVIIKGTSQQNEISIIPDNMLVGDLEALEGGSNIIVGDSLAYELNAAIGDSVNLLNIDQSNPLIGVPRVIAFKVVGIFSVGSEVDQNYALISQDSFLKLIKPKNGIGLEIKVKNVLDARKTGRAVIQKFDSENYIKMTSWDQSYGGLFRAVQLEKIMVGLLMSLILLVAILSLLMSVNNLIKTNEKEIAILRTIGFSKWDIQSIFIQLVLTIGIFGIFFGNILGFFLASNITEFLNFLSQIFNISMLDVYYLDYFPSIINFQQIVWINIITFLLLLIFSFIPSNKAANTNPVNIVNKT